MRLLDRATVGYLTVCLVVIVTTRPVAWIVLSLVHLSTIAVILLGCRTASSRFQWLHDWYPLLLIPLLYAEIPILNLAFLSDARDASIRSLETALFPSDPARTFAEVAPWRLLSEALHLAYVSYYVIIYAPFLILFFTRKREAFLETAFVVAMTYYCCYLLFIVVPVRGPWDLLPISEAPADGLFRRLAIRILEAGSSVGDSFPSSHQAVAVAHAICARRHLPRLFPVIGLLAAGIGVGAVYASFHYAVDMIAGAAFGGGIAIAARWWCRRGRLRCAHRQ